MVFLSPRGRSREVPLRAMVPNFITTMALCAGLASLHFSMIGQFDRAMGAVLVAAVLDVLDGRAARLLRVQSQFGAVLDSLSDFLAFGVAPVVLIHQLALVKEDFLGLTSMTVYTLCAALRLARFTSAATRPAVPADGSAAQEAPSAFFQGLPSPAAAGVVLIPPLLEHSPTVSAYVSFPAWYVVLHTVATALLMISTLPMFSIKRIKISPKVMAPAIVFVGLIVVSMIKDWWLTIASLSGLYLALIPLAVVLNRRETARVAG